MSSSSASTQNQFTSLGGVLIPSTQNYTVAVPANTATLNVSIAQSGATFLIPNPTGTALTVNLPAVGAAAGCEYTFLSTVGPVKGTTIITPTTSVLQGIIRAAGSTIPCINKATISNITGAVLPGDFCNVVSDGTNWYVNCQGQTGASWV